MTNLHSKRDGNLIIPCFNLIYFVILPAGIRFIGRKKIVYLTNFLMNHTDITWLQFENCFFCFLNKKSETENMNATVAVLGFYLKKHAKTA